MSYCSAIEAMPEPRRSLHARYHDEAYGFPVDSDNGLFCRLVLEINQAGLSWETILKKEENFRTAYDGFDIDTVAAYDDVDRERLLSDAGIVRNRLKVNAAIENAKTIQRLQREYGSFDAWLDHHYPRTRDKWARLFRKTFRFTGGEIVNEFLMSIGFLPGAHDPDCPVYAEILKHRPRWLDAPSPTQ